MRHLVHYAFGGTANQTSHGTYEALLPRPFDELLTAARSGQPLPHDPYSDLLRKLVQDFEDPTGPGGYVSSRTLALKESPDLTHDDLARLEKGLLADAGYAEHPLVIVSVGSRWQLKVFHYLLGWQWTDRDMDTLPESCPAEESEIDGEVRCYRSISKSDMGGGKRISVVLVSTESPPKQEDGSFTVEAIRNLCHALNSASDGTERISSINSILRAA